MTGMTLTSARRRRIAAIGVVVTLLVAVGAAPLVRPASDGRSEQHSEVLKDGMNGPYGAFPPPVVAEPPSRSARESVREMATVRQSDIDTVRGDPLVFEGVYLLYKGSDVRATGIRTGKTYWWYHRRDKFLADIELDRKGGDVYLTWRGPRSPGVERDIYGAPGDVESIDRVDITTGKILWRQDLAGAIARSGAGQDEEPVVGGIRTDADTVVLLTRRLVIGLARGDGRQRWVFRQPKDCTVPLRRERLVAAAGTLVVPQECTEDGKGRIYLAGIDAGTGSPRWRLGPGQWRTSGVDPPIWTGKNILKRDMGGRSVLIVGSAGSTRVIDPADGRVVSRAHGFDPMFSELSGDLLVQGDCLGDEGFRGWCGRAFGSGELRWRRPEPQSFRPEPGVFISHGRAYVMLTESDQELPITERSHELGILDPRTGRWLGRLAMHGFDGDVLDKIVTVQDGIILVRSRHSYRLYAEPNG